MSVNVKRRVAAGIGLWMFTAGVLGHVESVHMAITANAAASALSSSTSFNTFLNAISLDCDLKTATNTMIFGSFQEDYTRKDPGGVRVLNHFYDPLTGRGIDNPLANDPADTLGKDSFSWASIHNGLGIPRAGPECLSNENPLNGWSWQNARVDQWDGLTRSSREDRNVALTYMFRALGQVMHLLEDTSQPQHARNEQHIPIIPCIPDSWHSMVRSPWRSSIEDYGKANLANLNYQHGMLDWRNAGFTKLEDFWDRHLYNGNASALAAHANGGSKLGLAELINGNFLGERHLYAELMTATRFEFGYRQSVVTERKEFGYYPYPSRDTSTDYEQQKRLPVAETFTLKNGQEGAGLYIKKIADGIAVGHHSRMNYLGAKLKEAKHFEPRPFCTVNDEKVLNDYHAIVITNAIYYSAGLLDYFFRGRLETTVSLNTSGSGGTHQLIITNMSSQNFRGGTFHLFYDDISGNRTELASEGNGFLNDWNPTTSDLPTNAALVTTFTPPFGAARFLILYKGTIGTGGTSQASDPIDQGIAIAAKSFLPLHAYWQMDEASTSTRTDIVQGLQLHVFLIGSTMTSITGKFTNATRLTSFGNIARLANIATPGLRFGGGMTMCGWFRYSLASENSSFSISLTASGGYRLTKDALFTSATTTPYPMLSENEWHFYVLELTPSAVLQVEFDHSGAVYSLNSSLGLIWFPRFSITGGSGGTLDIDDTGFFPFLLSTEQRDFLWNSGAGRSYPFSLP